MTPRTAAKNQAALDRAAVACKDAAEHAARVQMLASDKPTQQAANAAVAGIMQAMNAVIAAGAAPPFAGLAQVKAADENRLELSDLADLDDTDLCALLAALESAQEIAERIDAKRGRVVPVSIPLGPGESRGTDLAETISTIAQRVRVEVNGPKGWD